MTKIQPLLSICIPTYNRCEELDITLKALISNPDVDDRVEIIVSDNCSMDNTRQVVEKYSKIKYYCNTENIKDKNFTKVLQYGNGAYLKLLNDSAIFNPKMIAFILGKIEEHMHTKTTLCFMANQFTATNTKKTIHHLSEYISTASFLITAISNYGIWKEHFIEIENKNSASHLHFLQVDWSLRNIQKRQNAIIYFNDYMHGLTPKYREPYNPFKTFIVDYLSMYKPYIKQGLINQKIVAQEKYYLYRYFVKFMIAKNLVDRYNYKMETKKALKIVFNTYKRDGYFYISLPEVFFNLTKEYIKKIFKAK